MPLTFAARLELSIVWNFQPSFGSGARWSSVVQKTYQCDCNYMLDLNDIALFVQVVRAGSFAAAARRLGMPSNTVSRRVQELEQQLGVRILQRTTRRLTLTAAGEILYKRSAEQIGALIDAAREVGEASEQPTGKVRVGVPADFFRWFPVAWMADFLAEHPKIQLAFFLSDDDVNLIDQGLDVAIRAGTVSDSSLVARLIGMVRFSLVASPSYLSDRGIPQSLMALATHDCILMPTPTGRAVWKLTGPIGEESVEVSGRFQANTVHVVLEAAFTGLGSALLPTSVTAPYVQTGEVTAVLPQYSTDIFGFHVVYPSRQQLPRAVVALVDFTMAKMRDTGVVSTLTG